MIVPRLALSTLAVLALAACAQSKDDKNDEISTPPFGYELAMAQEPAAPRFQATTVVGITPEQLRNKLDSSDIRLIDVRTSDEVAQGIIPGAEHIALDQFDPATLDLSDGREVVLYCRSGRRSGVAGNQLAQHIGEPVKHLDGGILAWKQAELEAEIKR